MNELEEYNRQYWKYGLIYNNPNDPDLIVKKLNGFGWTFNFAHSRSSYVIGTLLAIAAITIIFTIIENKG